MHDSFLKYFGGIAKARRNGHTCQAKGMGAFRSKPKATRFEWSGHAKTHTLRAFHCNPLPEEFIELSYTQNFESI
jgi:hypothetical protein